MKRIAVMITDMFQDVEYECPEIFIRAGHEFVNVGTTEGALVKGEQGMIVKITAPQRKISQDVTANEFDALFILWGCSPDNSVSTRMRSGWHGNFFRPISLYLPSVTRLNS